MCCCFSGIPLRLRCPVCLLRPTIESFWSPMQASTSRLSIHSRGQGGWLPWVTALLLLHCTQNTAFTHRLSYVYMLTHTTSALPNTESTLQTALQAYCHMSTDTQQPVTAVRIVPMMPRTRLFTNKLPASTLNNDVRTGPTKSPVHTEAVLHPLLTSVNHPTVQSSVQFKNRQLERGCLHMHLLQGYSGGFHSFPSLFVRSWWGWFFSRNVFFVRDQLQMFGWEMFLLWVRHSTECF